MYREHPSEALKVAFRAKPYQGVDPMSATCIFVGLDANYAPDVEGTAIFNKILEYHEDGVGFWRTYGVHHPFMLPEYKGDGRFYHESFSRVGFTSEDAEKISFVELLDVATVGRNNLHQDDLNARHLQFVSEAILKGSAKYVFMPATVAKIFRGSPYGAWLPSKAKPGNKGLKVWYEKDNVVVFQHLHFSVYGKFEAQKQKELQAINYITRQCG